VLVSISVYLFVVISFSFVFCDTYIPLFSFLLYFCFALLQIVVYTSDIVEPLLLFFNTFLNIFIYTTAGFESEFLSVCYSSSEYIGRL